MKNKKMTYILIVLVVVIWSGIFYRIFRYMNKPEETYNPLLAMAAKEDNEQQSDTFSILADYRDPFLSRLPYSDNFSGARDAEQTPQNTPVRQKPVQEIQPRLIKWPVIQYGGKIFNPRYKKSVGLMKINNRECLINEGDTVENVRVVALFKDSVKVMYSKEIKTFTIK